MSSIINKLDKPILDRKFQSSLSMPLSMIETIDKCKGPMVTRSRYVVSLLEKALKEELELKEETK
ncbi:MAG: hypothetical protein WA941_08460 [Nitrososphaeraceae archaeon]